MKVFGKLTTDGAEKVTDRLGGNSLFETDVYEGQVKLAYVDKSSRGAASLNVTIDINGQEYRETFWVTNAAGDNTYPDKNDKTKKHLLPGYIAANDLCMMTTELPLTELEAEDKVVEIYNFEAKKALPTNVKVFTEMHGQPVLVAIIKQTVNKQQKDSQGVYQNTAETRDENTSEKFFHPETKQTLTEAIEGIEGGIFMTKWLETNKGKTRNRVKDVAGTAGRPGGSGGGMPASGGAGQVKAKTSLFGK